MAELADPMQVFTTRRNDYERMARYVHDIVKDHFSLGAIQSSEWRAKTIESFSRKCEKQESGERKYDDPITQLTDLAGARFIVFTRDQVDAVCSEIRSNFHVSEEIDVGERIYKDGRFGYQSKHLIVRLTENRAGLKENRKIADLCCEVQVRTLIQHAWAAIEHKIQYKRTSEIPLNLSKRFSALAGALELADRELQNIVAEGELIRSAVQDELEKSLTYDKLAVPADPDQAEPAGQDQPEHDVRTLVRSEKYFDAEKIYSTKIQTEPKASTLYLGRAKVRFLSGDTVGALNDLDKHDSMRGSNVTSQRLRSIITTGAKSEISLPAGNDHSERLREAEQALQQADGAAAFEIYSDLEADGYNRAFAYFGMAMACALRRDFDGSSNYLTKLSIIAGTPMAINICALHCILFSMQKVPQRMMTKKLKDALENFPNFQLNHAPIRFFIEGCKATGQESHILQVQAILSAET